MNKGWFSIVVGLSTKCGRSRTAMGFVEAVSGNGGVILLIGEHPSFASVVLGSLDFGGLFKSGAALCLPNDCDFEPGRVLTSQVGKVDVAQLKLSPPKQALDAILHVKNKWHHLVLIFHQQSQCKQDIIYNLHKVSQWTFQGKELQVIYLS